jgi:hypothetical protein
MSIPIYMATLLSPNHQPTSHDECVLAMNAMASGKSEVVLQFHQDGKTTREFI